MLRAGFRRVGVWTLFGAALALVSGSAGATPLNLGAGDEITTIEWDALLTGGNPGDGGSFSVSTNIFSSQGRVTSVEITTSPPQIPQTGVVFDFNLNFVSESVTPIGGTFVNATSTLRSPGAMIGGPDVTVIQNGNVILVGNFVSDVTVSGVLDLSSPSSTLSGVGSITIVGGDANLVAALGGTGSMADLFLSTTLAAFDPPLANLATDLQVWNSDFDVSMSGTLIPLSSSPFVPEPSTALLLGGGLVGLLGLSRRGRARRGSSRE